MYTRYCKSKIKEALTDTPIVIVTGPRQAGKTTLSRQIQPVGGRYITLDDLTQYNAAKQDPVGFIRNQEARCLIIDEVQRVPELFLSIKQSVDEDRKPGRYLLTGSSNALMLPTLSDSLAGRMEVIDLLPLTTCEIENVPSTFIDKVFSGVLPTSKLTRVRKELIHKILSGGFPEPFSRKNFTRRAMWHKHYINSLIKKDVKDLENIEHLSVMPKLVRLLAAQVASLLNYSEIANKLGITRQTTTHYTNLLERLFLFEPLQAWQKSEAKRLIKTPKLHIVDTGLLCALRRLNEEKIADNLHDYGYLLESYIVNEIRRFLTWHNEEIELYHFRDKDKIEVDLVLESYDGLIVGIEIKGGSTLTKQSFSGLSRLRDLAGESFIMGLVLYDGDHSTQHGEKLFSAPIGCLWE